MTAPEGRATRRHRRPPEPSVIAKGVPIPLCAVPSVRDALTSPRRASRSMRQHFKAPRAGGHPQGQLTRGRPERDLLQWTPYGEQDSQAARGRVSMPVGCPRCYPVDGQQNDRCSSPPMTPERMDWSDDERLYQPRIHSRHIRAMHRICEELREPMTVMVDRALEEFVGRHGPNQMNPGVGVVLYEDVADADPVASESSRGDPIRES